jgi:ATP-dependent helicase/nuclease subunit A
MSENAFQPTPEQVAAIHAVGRSVLVSAAAGSGKTAVLAQRCAYLVCDAPAPHRCNIDDLLVLTFTEAAAAEMRSRIIACIRERLRNNPSDARLREQLTLANAAHISTIHSFCLWLIRRWFSEADIDPSATVMDADEASLLKREVLDRIFNELYAFSATPGDPLGAASLSSDQPPATAWDVNGWSLGRRRGAQLGEAFLRLVDHYGLGSDAEITAFVLRLYEFTTSLPDWRQWLTQAVERPSLWPHDVMANLCDELETELRSQIEHVTRGLARFQSDGPTKHTVQLQDYVANLQSWLAEMEKGPPSQRWAALDGVRERIGRFEFQRMPRGRGVKAPTSSEEQQSAFAKAARAMFRGRIRRRYGFFAVAEWTDGLRTTAPHIATLCDLVARLHEEYGAEKRRLGVIDFADLERLAFDLLVAGDVAEGEYQPSPIARSLHAQFSHVLVDEFQDINPLQEAILGLVSRERSADLGDNLFAVGDIKQSIYRFRLAEPSIFAERLEAFKAHSTEKSRKGTALFLQRNFRSRPEILEAVNVVFGALMNGAGGIRYDEEAALRAGRTIDTSSPRETIELHVLERTVAAAEEDAEDDEADDAPEGSLEESSEPRVADYTDPAHWTPIEREAYLIGRRIQELVKSPSGADSTRSRQFRDIAVLLRATKVNAERMAAMLNAMGVPAHAEVGGSLFAAREVRDVIAALRVLDNQQQDIPLAALLGSGILGERLTPDELVEVRLLDRRAPFLDVVRRYAKDGPEVGLRQRLADLVARIQRYREQARRRPLSETLWAIYEEEGFLAHCAGLPNGSQRRANLIKLHDLARKFDTFRLQGLHRFLTFLESLEKDNQDVDVAPAVGQSDNVVRIMSIHQSKGLEFPVVFVAGLGNQFNLGDVRGRMIFERSARVGLRTLDTEKMIEYPSAAHRLAAAEIDRTSREEELRILYVAMTRARDKLVLIGSRHNAEALRSLGTPESPLFGCSAFSVASAQSSLDWLLPVLHERADKVAVCSAGQRAGPEPSAPLFAIELHTQSEIETWRVSEPASADEQQVRQAVARLEPLPREEPMHVEDDEVRQVVDRLNFSYPHLAATSVKATLAASGLNAELDPSGEISPSLGPRFWAGEFVPPSSRYVPAAVDEPTQKGTLTHRVLQHLDFARAVDAAGVTAELQRMIQCGVLTADQCSGIDHEALTWFVGTPLARRICEAGSQYRRELRFVANEAVRDVDPSTVASEDDRVLVRGIIDGIIVRADELEVIDFKTDAVTANDLETRAQHYDAQMDIYSRASSRLWGKPVRSCSLIFLTPRHIVSKEFPGVQPMASAGQQVFSWMVR